MSTVEAYIKQLPPITRTYLLTTLSITLLCTLNIIDYSYLYLDWSLIRYKFHIWRLITNFLFFGKFSMPFVFTLILLVRYFNQTESTYYNTNQTRPDFIYALMLCIIGIYSISLYFNGFYFNGSILIFYVLYIWSRKQPYTPIDIYGFIFSAWQLPFILVFIGMLMGNNPMQDIVGIVLGHIYIFINDIYPSVYNRTLLYTPQWLTRAVQGKQIIQNVRPAWASGQGHRLN